MRNVLGLLRLSEFLLLTAMSMYRQRIVLWVVSTRTIMTTNNRSPSEPPNRLISNGTVECKTSHRVAVLSSAEETSKLVFTNVGAKKVKCLLLGEDVLTVEVLSATGTGGQTDGAKATFSQPTSCSTEASTVCVTDLATGTLKMIARPSGLLLKYLENRLNKFLRVFGVHRRITCDQVSLSFLFAAGRYA